LSRQGFASVFKRSLFANGLGVDPADDDMLLERSAGVVSAVVAWLCHADCRVNGELIQAEAGAVSRLSFALAQGIRDPQLTIETVRDNVDKILDLTDSAFPQAFLPGAPPPAP